MTTKKNSSFVDFANLDVSAVHERGVEVQVLHPVTGEPLPAYVTLRGEESSTVQAFSRATFNTEARRDPNDVRTIEELEDHAILKLTTATISWRGIGWGDEAEIPCTPENCKRIYSNRRIRRQLLDAMVSDANFPLPL